MRINFRNVLAWIFLLIAVVLVLWLIFGDSPTELAVFSVVAGFVLVKMWDMSERQIELEMRAKNGFNNMGEDMSLVKRDMGLIKKRLGV